jgi:hypothetical protein
MLGRLGFVALALALAAATPAAMAAEGMIGSVAIHLPPPAGFCDMTERNPSDKRMITTLTDLLAKSGNKFLAMSADCRQLADWHTGKRQLLDDYAQYQAPIATLDASPSETVAQTCSVLRAQGETILANQLPDLKARVESTLSQIKMNETSFIGVLAEDPAACYAGLIQKIRTEAGTDKTQVTMFAVTILKNRSVFVYRFAVYMGGNSVNEALGKLKTDVTALAAANR